MQIDIILDEERQWCRRWPAIPRVGDILYMPEDDTVREGPCLKLKVCEVAWCTPYGAQHPSSAAACIVLDVELESSP